MPADPYATLGLSRTATAEEIKKAYRKLVRTSHPDLRPDDPGAEARFKAISAAHDILKDPETRARFDAGEIDGLGAERPQREYYRDFAGAAENVYQRSPGQGGGADPADLFEEILRRHRRSSGTGDSERGGFQFPGADLYYTLEVGFLEAVQGGKTGITLPDGQGLAVRIPQGTVDGQTLRLRGKGALGQGGGPAGDALITVKVRPHPVFRREGDDIFVTLPVTIDEAVLGGRVTAPTIDGPVELTIPRGASSGRILRLRGRGVARSDGNTKGDQMVELQIVVPPDPDADLCKFLKDWRSAHRHDPRDRMLKEAAT